MMVMVLGLIVFIGIHVVASLRELRAKLIGAIGEAAYKGLFSLLAAGGLALTVYGFALWRAAGPAMVWEPPLALRHVTLLLMLLACICAVAAYVPSHLRTRLKHPLLVAVKTWAVAHLLANGDAASMMLFGAVLAWAVYDRIALRRRGAPVPASPAGWAGDALAVVAGVVLYALLAFLFHPYVIGVPVT
ncbi:NnrU family protein [Xanthobacter sediminis]|uniref:NnrU family protein n=1 Tax=Xanthobacter sediminis TaxID=3119926 RepID=UPI00372A44D0